MSSALSFDFFCNVFETQNLNASQIQLNTTDKREIRFQQLPKIILPLTRASKRIQNKACNLIEAEHIALIEFNVEHNPCSIGAIVLPSEMIGKYRVYIKLTEPSYSYWCSCPVGYFYLL